MELTGALDLSWIDILDLIEYKWLYIQTVQALGTLADLLKLRDYLEKKGEPVIKYVNKYIFT